MNDRERLKLLYGPYEPPRARRGDVLTCEYRGRDVKVGGMSSDAPIQWPTALKTGKRSLIVCGDLARAVRTESEIAVAHHWGVSVVTVWYWRKALGVPQITEGTARLYEDYKPEKLTDDVVALGREHAREPEVRERMAETKRGVPAHPNTRAALMESCQQPKSDDWKRQARERMVGKRPWGPNSVRPDWTPNEDALLGTDRDRAVAQKVGRTIAAVRQRRQALGIPAYIVSPQISDKILP